MSPSPAPTSTMTVPLCVDLDGTLIRSDMLWESFVRLIAKNPLWLFYVPLWWMRGRACLKRELAKRVTIDASALPFNRPFVEFLITEKRAGRRLVLATASDAAPAQRVADHLGLFD